MIGIDLLILLCWYVIVFIIVMIFAGILSVLCRSEPGPYSSAF